MSRKIVNISLPDELKKEVDKAVDSGRYASRSEFFRHLMRIWIDQNMEEVSDAEQRDIEKRYGKKPSGKRARGYSLEV